MRYSLLFSLALLGAATPAAADIVYSNDFDAENGGATQLNYAGFDGLTVTDGTVDLIAQGGFGLNCAGGAGSCVDLDGSTGNTGILTSTAAYSFAEGEFVRFSVDISGNQRSGSDSINLGFRFDDPTNFVNYGFNFSGTDVVVFPTVFTTFVTTFTTLAFDAPYGTYSIFFTGAPGGGSVRFTVFTAGDDNIGPVIDNVVLDIAAVPEPTTWGMLIAGFGAIGGTLRRRKPLPATA